MASRQFAKIWKESALGQGSSYGADPFVPPGSPVLNTDYVVPVLVSDDSLTIVKTPNQAVIRSWHAWNRPIKTVSKTYNISGSLMTYAYASQMPFWAESVTPNGTSNNTPSYVIDRALVREDDSNTIQRVRYLGVKFSTLEVSSTADDQVVQLKLDFVAQKPQTNPLDGTTFPEPAWNQYPSESPYTHADLTIRIGNTVRTEFNSCSLTIANIIAESMNEKAYVTRLKWCGRDVNLSSSYVFVDSTDRAAWEAATELTTNNIKYDNGVNSVTFTLGTCVHSNVEDALSMSDVFRQNCEIRSQFNGTNDLAITTS